MVCTNTFIESFLQAYMPSQRTCSSWFPISISGTIICPVPRVKSNSAFWNANFQGQLFREPMGGFIWVFICLFPFSVKSQIMFFSFLFPFIYCLFSPPLSVHSLRRWSLEIHLWNLFPWNGTEKFWFRSFLRQNQGLVQSSLRMAIQHKRKRALLLLLTCQYFWPADVHTVSTSNIQQLNS